jgi:hypothetical protein
MCVCIKATTYVWTTKLCTQQSIELARTVDNLFESWSCVEVCSYVGLIAPNTLSMHAKNHGWSVYTYIQDINVYRPHHKKGESNSLTMYSTSFIITQSCRAQIEIFHHLYFQKIYHRTYYADIYASFLCSFPWRSQNQISTTKLELSSRQQFDLKYSIHKLDFVHCSSVINNTPILNLVTVRRNVAGTRYRTADGTVDVDGTVDGTVDGQVDRF